MKMDNISQIAYYQINVALMIQLGKYFDYLRDNGVYDNTRIIIGSDHGRYLHHFEDLFLGDGIYDDIMAYNLLLLFKDFNSFDFSIDGSFMTNADVPTLAVSNLIENPINPFTHKLITNEEKYLHPQYILDSDEWHVDINNVNTYLPGSWFEVQDSILGIKNWKKVSE